MSHSAVNLKAFLRVIFPAEYLTWIKDVNDSGPVIDWVSLQGESGKENDLLLIQAEDLNTDEIKLAKKNGIAAILVVGEEISDLEFTSEIPMVFVKTNLDLRAIERKFIELITAQDDILTKNRMQIHTRLARLAGDGLPITELAKAMLEISRHGILIQDKRLNIIASCPSIDLEFVWDDITGQVCKSNNLPKSLQDRRKAGEENIKVVQQLSGGVSRIILPISTDKIARGYLSIIGLEGSLDTLDHLVAEEGALICAIDMARSKAVRATEKKLQSDLLAALLQKNLSPRDAKLWFDAIGLDWTQSHAALQFSWDSPNPPSKRRLETLIQGEVIRAGVQAIINPAGEAIVCFCQVPPEYDGQQVAISLAKHIVEQAHEEFPDINIRCGIGTPSENLNQWHSSFREAGLALDMAVRLEKNEPLYYSDLSVYRLLLLLEHNPELRTFQEDILGSLIPGDKTNNFIETLEAYFENNRNLSQTADALFIHRNTLSYRLERIKEISGLDINNYETALAVQLALKIYRMLKRPG